MRSRVGKPSARKDGSKGIRLSDMICPNEDPFFDAGGDLLEQSFRYTRAPLNRYDPKRWPNAELHRDSNNAGDSRMIVQGDYQAGDFLIEDHGQRATPTRIRER